MKKNNPKKKAIRVFSMKDVRKAEDYFFSLGCKWCIYEKTKQRINNLQFPTIMGLFCGNENIYTCPMYIFDMKRSKEFTLIEVKDLNPQLSFDF